MKGEFEGRHTEGFREESEGEGRGLEWGWGGCREQNRQTLYLYCGSMYLLESRDTCWDFNFHKITLKKKKRKKITLDEFWWMDWKNLSVDVVNPVRLLKKLMKCRVRFLAIEYREIATFENIRPVEMVLIKLRMVWTCGWDMQVTLSAWLGTHLGTHACTCSVMFNSLQHQGLQPARLLWPWDFPGKNTGVDYYFLLEGIFPAQGSSPHLLCLLH